MARDTQRKRVYDAEHAAFDKSKPAEGYTVAEMQQLIDKWRSSKVLQRRYPRARLPLKVTDGRGRRIACFAPDLYYRNELKMPRWSRSKWILIHEFAHALTYSRERAWHGWEFCECYLYLVRVHLGRGAEETLRREFKAHRVRYHKPRKRLMTEEQREAARQRMLAMHAERKVAACPAPGTAFAHRCKCGHRHDEHETPAAGPRYSGRCRYVLRLSGKRCRCEGYRPQTQ